MASPQNPQVDKLLHRHLSLNNPISPSPQPEPHQPPFRKIGAGACGVIFSRDGKSQVAIKLAKSPDPTELWNDYQKHITIFRAFRRHLVSEVQVPEVYFFAPRTEQSFWTKNPDLLDAAKNEVNLPAAALVTERILPLPLTTRALLVEKYCAPRLKDQAHVDVANRDCLVRVYLGSTKGKTGQMFFSLRNFKLHLNHMVDLELDTEALAGGMGRALAVLHWGAKTDARDVEFVLGSSKRTRSAAEPDGDDGEPRYTGPESRVIDDFFCPVTGLFVLDFNQVRTMTMDDGGVAMAMEAWRLNDPYFPKPLRKTKAEESVWRAFLVSYLAASDEVMSVEGCEGEARALPGKFIAGITEVERAKMRSRME